MSLNHSPAIVTDGLVLCVDAANQRSYPGTGTTATDLKNGFQGTLQNSPSFSSTNSGAFTFDGSDERIIFTDNIAVTEATFLAWIKRSGNQASNAAIILSRGDGGSTTGLNFYSSSEDLGYHWNGSGWGFDSNLLVPDGEWCMVAVSVNSSSAVFYLYQNSGVSTATKTASHTSSNLNNIEIGGDPNSGGRQFTGDLSIAATYNRALSAEEIRQNYEATVGRYT